MDGPFRCNGGQHDPKMACDPAGIGVCFWGHSLGKYVERKVSSDGTLSFRIQLVEDFSACHESILHLSNVISFPTFQNEFISGKRCDAKVCNQVSTYENILDNFCQADFGEGKKHMK